MTTENAKLLARYKKSNKQVRRRLLERIGKTEEQFYVSVKKNKKPVLKSK